jgi:Sulfotransferase family
MATERREILVESEPASPPAASGFAFIVGHRKSGSTWLLNLLSLHPEVRGVMETSLFEIGWREPDPRQRTERVFRTTPWSKGGGLRARATHRFTGSVAPLLRWVKPALELPLAERPAFLPDLSLFEQMALKRRLLAHADPAEYCRVFFGFLRDRMAPSGYLIEKSPRQVQEIERIHAVFPGAKLIMIYRDGRDVVVSDRFFTRDYGRQPFSFEQAIHDWRAGMEAQFLHAEAHDAFVCSYESLLSDGRGVVRNLLEYLALPYDAKLIDRLLERSSFHFYTGRNPGQENRRRFYRKGIAGDWKNHFSPGEKETFKEMAGDLLITLGYEKDLDW